MKTKSILGSISFMALAACTSANMQIGQSQSYLSLQDQRLALESVDVVDVIPANATFIGEVEASRCHRNAFDKAPEQDNVVTDLRVAAFAQGADIITDIEIDQKNLGGIIKNCWHVKDGKAKMYRLPKTEAADSQ